MKFVQRAVASKRKRNGGERTAQWLLSKRQSKRLIQYRARNSLFSPRGSRPANLAAAQKASQQRSDASATSRSTAWDWVRRRTASMGSTGAKK
jgi:hypothetical protein